MQRVRNHLTPALVVFVAAIAAGSIGAGVQTTAPGSADSPSTTTPVVRPGHVLGVVTSADAHANLQGVVVQLIRDQRVVDRTLTNKDGKFAFPNIRPGHFQIAAEKRGVGVGHQPGDVKPAETVRIEIALKKPA
ncbi:MAG: carboxypeptidase-like regulatory domain-containing protein [Phycisphaerales bacterium]